MQKFLHPGERKILQRIATVATKYHKIQKFIKSVTEPEGSADQPGCIKWALKFLFTISVF